MEPTTDPTVATPADPGVAVTSHLDPYRDLRELVVAAGGQGLISDLLVRQLHQLLVDYDALLLVGRGADLLIRADASMTRWIEGAEGSSERAVDPDAIGVAFRNAVTVIELSMHVLPPELHARIRATYEV